MMLQKKVLFSWILISSSMFLLSRCTRAAEAIATPFSAHLLSTPSQVVSTSDITEIAIPTITQSLNLETNEIIYHCATIKDDLREIGALEGTLVLNGYIIVLGDKGKQISNPLLLINSSSGNEIRLSIEAIDNHFAVSPGRDYLAYDVWRDGTHQWQIHIVDATGSLLKTFDEEDMESFEWLDSDNLFINSLSDKFKHLPLVLVSPFDDEDKLIEPFITEEERKVPSDHELIYEWGFYAFHKIIYNSTFTRAIYAASDGDGAKIVFRDLLSNKDISTLPSHEAWGVSPKWSPDGTQVAIGLNTDSVNRKYELVVFDQNARQLFTTHLAWLSEENYISSLSWSPDGRKIAFWYTTNDDINRDLRLAIFDLLTQKIIDYCITKNSPLYRWHTNDKSPLWSPDSKYLLLETAKEDLPNAVVLDVLHGNAATIKSSYEPVGWMK